MPAAIYRWRGAVSTAWKTGTNWIKTDGSTHDVADYPGKAAGDQAWFDYAVTTYSPAGIDLSSDADLLSFKVGSQFDGTLGSSTANPIIFDMQTGNTAECLIDAEGAGAMYLKGGGTNGIYRLTVTGSKTSLWLAGVLGATTLLKGTGITIDSTTTALSSLFVGYESSKNNDVDLTIEASSTLPSTIRTSGGTVSCSQAVTTLELGGGAWTQNTGSVTTLIMDGGTFYWGADEPTTTVPSGITTAYIRSGTLDGSRNLQARTITLAVIYTDGTLRVDNGMRNITVTQYDYEGGTIKWSEGERLARYS